MSRRLHPQHLATGHLSRQSEVARIFVEEGFGWLVGESGLSKVNPKRRIKHDAGGEVSPEEHVRRAFERLGVTFIKGGQALSTRIDVVSPALAAELAKLQDEVPPEPFDTMRAVLESELEMPLEQAFSSFDRVPLGSASIGQVYFATLPDGRPVAVKVQRPGVGALAEIDLDIAMALTRRVEGRLREMGNADIVGLAGEFADALRGEFDYAREGRNAERIGRAFAGHPDVVIPKVYWTHTTSRVLTLELLEGVRMNRVDELDAAGYDRSVLAVNGVNAYLHMMFDDGFFHADPHPGNFIALPGNRVGFTDFGRVGILSTESRERLTDLLYGVVNRDEEVAADALLAMASACDIDETALQKDVARVVAKYYGRELAAVRFGDLFRDALGLMRSHHLGMPNDFAVMLATLAVLEGTGMMLDPQFDFVSAVSPFVEEAMRRRLRPAELVERISQDLRLGVRTLERMPTAVDRILRRASRGEFRVEVAPREYQGLLDQISELVNRLAFAIVVAALIVGATTLLSATRVPVWLSVVGQIGLVAALMVTFWLFGSIIFAHLRVGRKR